MRLPFQLYIKFWFCSCVFFCLFAPMACTDSNAEDIEDSITLDQKLDAQFDLYDLAREKMVKRVVDENGVVGRQDWEEWLIPEDKYQMTEDDIAELTARQLDEIEASRDASKSASKISLDLIRSDADEVERYCSELPKGGMLHIHPGGTRNEQTIEEILIEVNPTVDPATILSLANDGELTMLYDEEVDFLSNLPVQEYLDYGDADQQKIRALFFLPDNPPTHDFMRFEALFSISDILYQDPEKEDWVEEKTYLDFLNRAASQNVTYVEFTKVMYPNEETFEQLHAWAEDWSEQTGVTVRWNSAFVRTLDYQTNSDWTAAFIDILRDNAYRELVGIDLLANETNTSALDTGQNIYVPILDEVEKGNISIARTMHAGELGDVRNVRDAMIMGVNRVGHGVLLWQDPVSLEYAGKVAELPIEINLYSNYRLQVEEDFSKHPFLNFLRLGLPVSLSTDDEGMFVTEINKECRIAVSNTDITHDEMRRMSYNSLKTAFADEELKTKLIKGLDNYFTEFESSWTAGEGD